MTSGPNATEVNLGLPNDLPLTKWAHRVSRIFHALMLADTRDPPSLPLTLSKPRAPHPLVPLIRSVRKGKNPQSAASPHPTRRPASNLPPPPRIQLDVASAATPHNPDRRHTDRLQPNAGRTPASIPPLPWDVGANGHRHPSSRRRRSPEPTL